MNEETSAGGSSSTLVTGLEHTDSLRYLVGELNTLFSQYRIPAPIPVYEQDDQITTWSPSVQVHPNSLLDLYNALFDPVIPLTRPVQDTVTSRVKSVKLLIGTIAQEILKMDLSYIDPLAVVTGDEDAVRELLQVVVAVGKIMRKKTTRAAQMQACVQAVDDDADESDVSVEPNSDYSDDLDSDQGIASDFSSGVSITQWKSRAETSINKISPLHRSWPSTPVNNSTQHSMPDKRSAKRLREYSPFGLGHSWSQSSLSIHKYHRRTRSFPTKSGPVLSHVSTGTNRIHKIQPTSRQHILHHSFGPSRRPLHYLHMASRAYPTSVPVTIAAPKRFRSTPLFDSIHQHNSCQNSWESAEKPTRSDRNDEWVTDDEDDRSHRGRPDLDRDIELSETSNEPIRIRPYYLELQTNSSGLSWSYAVPPSSASRPNLQFGFARDPDYGKGYKRGADLLSRSYNHLANFHQWQLRSPANTVIKRNENFVSPKRRSKFLHLKIDSTTSTSEDDDVQDDDVEDENRSLSSAVPQFKESRRRLTRLVESRSMHAKRERELRRKFMELSVG
ncbi:hypothetical protein V1517DRAFT_283816 [Lipomyces orientalis]|uniref:Uncharacterized protein n=1 Tax=Lipomyces orientalis TaxID=1233043 RepID=A0ACC3U0I1_9ASCO